MTRHHHHLVHALETAAIVAANLRLFENGPECLGGKQWDRISVGLLQLGAVGLVRTVRDGWMLLYSLYSDDPLYYGQVVDGEHRDRFAVTRESVVEYIPL